MRITAIASAQSACHLARLRLPFKYLAKDTPQHQWTVGTADRVAPFDALMLYGSWKDYAIWGQVAAFKRQGKRFVYTHDDTVWDHPDWRPDQPTEHDVNSVNVGCELADLIVASTPALADRIGKPEKTVVCRNLVEVGHYQCPTHPDDEGTIRIMWAGAAGHWADLDLIDDACCRIAEKWGDRVRFTLFGDGPDRLLRDHLHSVAHLTDWYPLSEHWYRLHSARPHVVLAPLVDCTFNHCKSNIRLLEGWSLNAAVVASPVGEYRIVQDGVNGLVAQTPDDWFGAMDRLIQDAPLRQTLAANGYATARSEWDWQNPTARAKWTPLTEWLDRAAGG